MGQRNADRRWPIPPRTRHVWVHRNSGPHDAPLQGYVISFRRESYRWRALVLVATNDDTATQAWIDLDRLTPITSDPNRRPPWNIVTWR